MTVDMMGDMAVNMVKDMMMDMMWDMMMDMMMDMLMDMGLQPQPAVPPGRGGLPPAIGYYPEEEV